MDRFYTDLWMNLSHESRAYDIEWLRRDGGETARQTAAHEVRRRTHVDCQVRRQMIPDNLCQQLEAWELPGTKSNSVSTHQTDTSNSH